MILPNGSGGIVIMPDSQQDEDKCPHCHKHEDIKQVCAHCGYIYPDEDGFSFLGLFMILFIIWLLITIMYYAIQLADPNSISLINIFKDQYHYVIKFITHLI